MFTAFPNLHADVVNLGYVDPETGLAYSRDANGLRIQSAGDGFEYPWGFWVSYQHSSFENNFAATAFDADTDTFLLGADFSPFDNSVAGVALAYSDTSTDTFFNSGGSDTDGFTVAPYFGILFDADGIPMTLSWDAAVGYSNSDVSQFRTTGGARITSTTDKDSLFFASNMNAYKDIGDFSAGARAGLFYGSTTTDAFTESDTTAIAEDRVTQGTIQLEGNVSYFWGNLQPYASLVYEIDISKDNLNTAAGTVQPANDTNDILLNLGLNYFGDNWTAGLGYETSLDRDQFDYDSISIRIRADF